MILQCCHKIKVELIELTLYISIAALGFAIELYLVDTSFKPLLIPVTKPINQGKEPISDTR